MTGLRNKKAFKEDIELLNCGCYFISIDENEIKRTNDTLGHIYGNELDKEMYDQNKKMRKNYGKKTEK